MGPQARVAAPCGLCGAEESEPLLTAPSPDRVDGPVYRLLRCPRCGFAFVHPAPPPLELASLYGTPAYYGAWSRGGRAFGGGLNRLLLKAKRRRLERLVPKGRLLDFGCGSGELLAEMLKAGWDARGVEPSLSGRAAVAPELVGRVEPALEPFLRRAERFDLITLWHVLEHLPDPVGTLRALSGLLAPGGRLLVAVPNLASWEARVGADWFHLDLPRHLCHFTPATLRAALKAAGLEVAREDYQSLGYNVFGLLQTCLNRLTPERNHLYNVLKRGGHVRTPPAGRRLAQGALTAALLPVLAPACLAGAVVAGAFRRGGTMEFLARLPE